MAPIRAALGVVAAALLAGSIEAPPARAETGVVAVRVTGCDYYLISTSGGYVLAEWYGGYDPSKGDFVAGAFNQYGFRTLFFGRGHEEGRAYIEDYWLDPDDALEQLSENCN